MCYMIKSQDLCSSVSCVFFFKQKTAYEMRISDWSSDVCSSDLVGIAALQARVDQRVGDPLHAVNIDTIADIAAAAAIAQLRHQIDTLARIAGGVRVGDVVAGRVECGLVGQQDRKSTRLNSSH